MPIIHHSAQVPCPQEEMFSLVDDLGHYADFLSWCPTSRELSRDRDEVRAELGIARGGFSRTFTVLHRRQASKMLELRLVEGPFRQLEGFWRFEPRGAEHCQVSFDLEYEFASRMIGLVAGPIFRQAADSLLDAFVTRAREVYGRR